MFFSGRSNDQPQLKMDFNNPKVFPWEDTNQTEDEKLSAWMVAETGNFLAHRNYLEK